MSQLNFEVIGSRPEPHRASPTLSLQLRITETTGARLHAIALRCQVQIEPRRRRYSREEEDRLLELVGEPGRWSETLQTIVWAQVPWEKEAAFALPVPVLRTVMDRYFPDTAWIRLRRESFDALHRFRGLRALPTWEETIETLLREARVGELS